MRRFMLATALGSLLLATGCSKESAPTAPAAPTGFKVQVSNATYNDKLDYTTHTAVALVNKAGTECTLWFYDVDVAADKVEDPDKVSGAFNAIKCKVGGDKPIVAGDQHCGGLWYLKHKAGDKTATAANVGDDKVKLKLTSASLDDGASMTGSIDVSDAGAEVHIPSFTAQIKREH
jgi:hypothetical protein